MNFAELVAVVTGFNHKIAELQSQRDEILRFYQKQENIDGDELHSRWLRFHEEREAK